MRSRKSSVNVSSMKKAGSSKGFSLVELMVAIAILSIGMAAVGAVLYASYASSRFNAGARRAEAAASQLAERFKAGNVGETYATGKNPCKCKLTGTISGATTTGTASFDTTNMDRDSDGAPDGHCWSPDSSLVKASYFCTWSVTDHASGYKRLTATVYWEGNGCTRDTPEKCKRRLRILNYFKPKE